MKQFASSVAVSLEKEYDIPHSEIYEVLLLSGGIKAYNIRYQVGRLADQLRQGIKLKQREIANLKALCRSAHAEMVKVERNTPNLLEADESTLDAITDAARKHLAVVKARAVARAELRLMTLMREELRLLVEAPKRLADDRDLLVNSWLHREGLDDDDTVSE